MEEIWKDVVGFEQHYKVSNLGNIMSLERTKLSSYGSRSKLKAQRIKPIFQKKTGYYHVTLRNGLITKQFLLHRVVAISFIQNTEKYPCVNHKDGIKTNNNISNLEWCSYKQNFVHAVENNLSGSRLILMLKKQRAVIQMDLMGSIVCEYESLSSIEKTTGFSKSIISRYLKNGKNIVYGFIWEYK